MASKEYCIARHDAEMCLLHKCRHLFLLGNFKELLQKLNPLCFLYQQVDCPNTLFKYQISEKIVAKKGQVFDKVKRAVCSIQKKSEELIECPAMRKNHS